MKEQAQLHDSNDTGNPNRRRSTRLLLKVPLVLEGLDGNGQQYRSYAETIMVSKHGARLSTEQPLTKGSELFVTVQRTKRREKARVVVTWEDSPGAYECAIELRNPENLWGISFPPEDWSHRREGEKVAAPQVEVRVNRRLEARTPARGEVIVRSDETVIYGEVADVSPAGFRIRYRGEPVQIGPEADVSYPWGRVTAKPIWFRKAGEWVEMGFSILERLD